MSHGHDERDNCALPLVRRVCALLGRDDAGVRAGDPLPRGWHFILFTPTDPQTILGPDGTPVRASGPEAPADLPRRMMGGRRFTFFSDIPVGADVRRTSKVISAVEKNGRSGRFLVRTTQTLIYVGDATEPALQEDFDTLFRAPATQDAEVAAAAAPQRRAADVRESVRIDETMLFRYSACTFNAHRIHYDHPYATAAEGYPALVVNAGLTVLLLRELGVRLMQRPLASMSTRNGRPIYCGSTVQLCARAVDGGYDLWAEDEQSNVCADVALRA